MSLRNHYRKGDVRRLLLLARALEVYGPASITVLARETGLDKRSVIDGIDKLRKQLGLVIAKEGVSYRLNDWGPVLNAAGVAELLDQASSDG